jgi:TonB family protein
VKVTFRLDRQGRVKGLKVVSTKSNPWVQEIATRMIRAAKFPPIPKEVIAEQGHDWVDVEAEWSFRI